MRGPEARRVGGALAVGVLSLSLLAGILALLPAPAAAASYSLWGSASQGWGFGPLSITSPGPLLTVSWGETVTLALTSEDSAPHTWCIDYNGNGACDVGEDQSPTFSSSTTPILYSFVPLGPPGLHTYICGIHGGSIMNGPIMVRDVPRVVVTSLAGSQGWTGGKPHLVTWNLTDFSYPPTSLTLWVNYSLGAGTFPIVGPVAGTANPNVATWDVPLVNSTSASVNVTAVDPRGNRTWDVRPLPTIDSSPPAVETTFPSQGASGISTAAAVVVTFNESMNPAATGAAGAVSLQNTTTLAFVPVTYSWDPSNTTLTMRPVSNLAPLSFFRAFVNVTARDASDPGNALPAPVMWVFRTASGADLTPPQISNVAATPALTEYGQPTNLSATITDTDAVVEARVNVTDGVHAPQNLTMTMYAPDLWSLSTGFPLGQYVFTVAAVDASGNWNHTAAGPSHAFQVTDTTKPLLGTPVVTPSPAEVYQPVNVSVSVTELLLRSVWIDVHGGPNETMDRGTPAGTWYANFTLATVATLDFAIYAVDTSGNTAGVTGLIVVLDTTPPPVPQSLTASIAPDGQSIVLTWSNVSAQDLKGYRVYRSTSLGGTFTAIGDLVSGTTYTDTSVVPGGTYYYRVTSIDLWNNESGPSNTASASSPGTEVDLTLIVAAVALTAIVIAVVAALLFVRRRRRKED